MKPSKKDMVVAYEASRNDVLKPRTIRNAWQTAGIWPRDRQAPLSSKYVILKKKALARTIVPALTVEERPVTPNFLTITAKITIETPLGSQALQITT
ncbi:hypothetical protein RRF57_000785 [Xylaria bambusicola]|uniref:Uncharacterized protein n=1 Tax=Xylaria bambusicola TaxID=326684 RepID=A0AAN7UP99_9PEZI